MRIEARGQALLLSEQLLLLLQQFLLLRNHAADFGTQVGEFFLERIHRFLRVGLFAFIMAAEALQQRFGLMIRMVRAAADRAGLIVLQLLAQLFDTGAACQTLTFQQFAGHRQGLFGHGQFVFGFHPVLGQAVALLLGNGLTLLQFGDALVQFLLASPQPRQLFNGAQLLAVVLQQSAQQLDLFGHRIRLGAGLFVEHFQILFLRRQFLGGVGGVLLQRGQFRLPFVQAIADQHQLLQAVAVGVPGIAERRQMGALLKFGGNPLQTLGNPILLLKQTLNRLLAFGAGPFRLLLEVGAEAGVLDQAGEGALRLKGLTQQWRA
ncbi:hypothetical protein D3C84_544380 [compost metagenome]